VLGELLSRRVVFVAGKGGSGKTTISAALALLAARAGRRVLCIEVDAKGDLSRSLGSPPVGFTPRVVQPNISVLALHPEESLQEYLRLYFKVPRITRLTPLARVFDFVATGVPGAKDMLIVGKIAYEAKRSGSDGPIWDLIIVDSTATGHVVPQLGAPRAMRELTRGGIIRSQTEWIDALLTDQRRTLMTICALPEEMPVVEALELAERVRGEANVTIGACFLNCTFPVSITPRYVAMLNRLADSKLAGVSAERLGGDVASVVQGVRLAQQLYDRSQQYARRLRSAMNAPVVEITLEAGARPGLSATRAVAARIGEASR
jgi:anion-transporting  ArsA/GET3 family ATPase